MLELLAAPFVRTQTVLAFLWGTTGQVVLSGGENFRITHGGDNETNGYVLNARQLEKDARALGAKVTANAAMRLVRLLESKDGYTSGDLADLLKQTVHLQVELEGRKFICLDDAELEFYAPPTPLFGAEVHDKFPGDARYEIQQAGKCLALGLSTAGAFHALRCLEAGIAAISRCLGIPDPTKGHERSWHHLLKAIKGEIDKRWPSSGDRMSGDGQFFDNAYAALSGMANPWRNATMHLDHTFMPDEARDVFNVVAGFMKRIASRMDEDGNPKA